MWIKQLRLVATRPRVAQPNRSMSSPPIAVPPLPPLWQALTHEHAAAANRELVRELCPGHVLLGRNCRAIAKCIAADDFLYTIDDLGQVAQVHLTYQVERRPNWPSAKIFDSLSDWASQVLAR